MSNLLRFPLWFWHPHIAWWFLLGAAGGYQGWACGSRAAQQVHEVGGDFTGPGVGPPSGMPVNRWWRGLGVRREEHGVAAQLIEVLLQVLLGAHG